MDEYIRLPACHPSVSGWVYSRLTELPPRFRGPIAQRYEKRYLRGDKDAMREANLGLLRATKVFPEKTYRVAADDGELIELAKRRARECRRITRRQTDDQERYRVLAVHVQTLGIAPPAPIGPNTTYRGCVARMQDEHWWRRQLRTDHGRTIEAGARELHLVHKDAGLYSSDETVHRRRGQKKRNRLLLDEIIAVNEYGQEYTLSELVELSVSNPAVRRAELMTRIAGLETIAAESGHVGEFITLTCPSRMHKAKLIKAGDWHKAVENLAFDGTTPREAQDYLCKVWARIRSKLHKHGIKLYGFRVVEPNHDGCPHWHLLLFFPPWQRRRIRRVFKHYALQVDGNEPGADKHRVTFTPIDKDKGRAAGYIAKYIAKNIDGFGLDADIYGNDPVAGAERVDAWASCWGIRQFQQLGGPPVTVWRELRRLEGEEEGLLGEAAAAADRGDWATFVRLMGGPTASRADTPIRPAYWQEIDTQTGELPLNRYGEVASGQIFGVQYGDTSVLTRPHRWEFRRRGEPLPTPVAIHDVNPSLPIAGAALISKQPLISDCVAYKLDNAVSGLKAPMPAGPAYTWEAIEGGRPAAPWSSVNNCTEFEGKGLSIALHKQNNATVHIAN